MKLTRLFQEFFNSEKTGGLILVFATIFSLFMANTVWQTNYSGIWNTQFGGHSMVHWINDGLMTVFFLLIGLELEREIYQGELTNLKNASMPIIGAIGGMLVPACIFLIFNFGTVSQSGAGIPMATDIAFAIGILSLLGNRVPASLKVFLTALAVIDDLGAIIIIAFFYTGTLSYISLLTAMAIFAFLLLLNRMKIHNLIPYLIGGVFMWYFMLLSGVHATITGVLLAFAIPFGDGGEKSPSFILQHILHKPVAFLILPIFALANTAIYVGDSSIESIVQSNSIGIIAGLIVGKPIGIVLFVFIGTVIGACSMPVELNWKNIIGIGFLAGIGFTMSIFITLLAFDNPDLVNSSKIAILIASLIAGIIGFVLLRLTLKPNTNVDKEISEI